MAVIPPTDFPAMPPAGGRLLVAATAPEFLQAVIVPAHISPTIPPVAFFPSTLPVKEQLAITALLRA